MKKVIILLSTYNGAEFLAPQLDTIRNQNTAEAVELYVRDDVSSDETLKILKEYEKRMVIHYAPSSGRERLGAAKSFWELLRTSPRADYYLFADQDDLWDIDKIAAAVKAMDAAQGNNMGSDTGIIPVLYCCNSRTVDKNGITTRENNQVSRPKLDIVSQIISGEVPGCAMAFNSSFCMMMRTKPVKAILMHDWLCLLYGILEGKVIYDENVHFSRRVHGNNAVASLGKTKRKRIWDALRRWTANNSVIRIVAKELLDSEADKLKPKEAVYLEKLYNAPNSIRAKYFILFSPMTRHNNKRAVRSFKIRLLLNLV